MSNITSIIVRKSNSEERVQRGGAFIYDDKLKSFELRFVGLNESEMVNFYLQVGGIADTLNDDN